MKISIRIRLLRKAAILVAFVTVCSQSFAQQKNAIIPNSKKISTDLFGLFFEDINYAADGGLYAEQVQNRSFEYNPTERKEWHPLSYWEYITTGFSYGRISVETNNPVHANNSHYIVLDVEHVGKEEKFTGISGVGIKNFGFEGMIVKGNDQYNFAMHARQLSKEPVSFTITLQTPQGKIIAETKLTTSSADWKKYTTSLTANQSHDTAQLVILATTKGKTAIDVVSLFPEKTFRNRPNGLRTDLAQLLADMKPSFIRFPGGCLVHGDGLGNMYRWKNTIGPIEERKAQRNIWGYHQTTGIGYFEYFQFCEDIGAKPLPVLPAAVSCQNSGGTWRIGGTGQRALPMEEMQEYIQEVLDLIEWANGPVTSTWGAKRAAAGHPAPFNLEYVGIGNEDKITPEFEQRFKMIHDAVEAKYPNIILVGTSGPFHSGEDFDKGWSVANQLKVDVIDEHYYVQPEWLISNQYRYDTYNRKASKVYLGEYASWGNKLYNAIAEALYMTGLERNGDVVSMASYAPLLAKDKFTQWKTDMIFFNNNSYYLTPNYHVQRMFSANAGDYYVDKVISKNNTDSLLAGSCVYDSETGDIILKLVNGGKSAHRFQLNLSAFPKIVSAATVTELSGDGTVENSFANKNTIAPVTSTLNISKKFNYETPAMSLTVIRIKTK
jgi:alpha-N-arabinofuranosidase